MPKPLDGLRLRRVRLAAKVKATDDCGPLVASSNDGTPQLLSDHGAAIDGAVRLDMPYPPAPLRGLSPDRWVERWRLSPARLEVVTDMLIASFPGLALLIPYVLLQAPNVVIRLAFAAGTLCLLSAAFFARQRLERDETVRIHARFWDRLIETLLPAADVDDANDDSFWRSFRLNRGLDGALALASERRKLLAPLLMVLIAASLLAASGAWMLMFMVFPALIVAFLLEKAALVANENVAQARQEFFRGGLRQSLWMPGLRQLGAAARELRGLCDKQQKAARYRRLSRVLNQAAGEAPLWLAVAVLAVAAILCPPADATNLPLLLLVVPAGYSASELGCRLCRIIEAYRRVSALAYLGLDKPGHNDTEVPIGRIESVMLKGICFRHDMDCAPIFADFSFAISRGEVVALMGPSGCGKSTLLNLLMGLKQPQAGQIAINGELRDWSALAGYRVRIAGTFQDMLADVATIRGVIGQHDPKARETDLLQAVSDAGLEEAISALPMGLQTLVVAGAFPQSLHQQLLIAGALVQKPDLLILDETFSALDRDVVERTIAAVRRRGMALVFASHRLDLAALADRIVDLALTNREIPCPRT